MRSLPFLKDVRQADLDLTCWLIYEQLEYLHADGKLSDDAWELIEALIREHEAVLRATRAREMN